MVSVEPTWPLVYKSAVVSLSGRVMFTSFLPDYDLDNCDTNQEHGLFCPCMPRNDKRFLSLRSLVSEQARLDTFIGWPLVVMSPSTLAANGFYYLRKESRCCCVFCCIVIDDWSSMQCHHYSFCCFAKGLPVGNITKEHCRILSKLPLGLESRPMMPVTQVDLFKLRK